MNLSEHVNLFQSIVISQMCVGYILFKLKYRPLLHIKEL